MSNTSQSVIMRSGRSPKAVKRPPPAYTIASCVPARSTGPLPSSLDKRELCLKRRTKDILCCPTLVGWDLLAPPATAAAFARCGDAALDPLGDRDALAAGRLLAAGDVILKKENNSQQGMLILPGNMLKKMTSSHYEHKI